MRINSSNIVNTTASIVIRRIDAISWLSIPLKFIGLLEYLTITLVLLTATLAFDSLSTKER